MPQSISPAVTPLQFRQALGYFATGVTVITTDLGNGRVHAMTANAFSSLSLDPPLALLAVDNASQMRGCLRQSGRFGVSMLGREQVPLARHFAGRREDALAGKPFAFAREQGYPLIPGAVATLLCSVVEAHPAGDHTLFIGLVEWTGQAAPAETQDPLLFYQGSFAGLANNSERRSEL